MQKIILILILIIPFSVLAGDKDIPHNLTEMTSLIECEEFKKLANKYYDKAQKNKLYEEQYNLVARNFEKMYQDCKFHINNNMPYEGFKEKTSQEQMEPYIPEICYDF